MIIEFKNITTYIQDSSILTARTCIVDNQPKIAFLLKDKEEEIFVNVSSFNFAETKLEKLDQAFIFN